ESEFTCSVRRHRCKIETPHANREPAATMRRYIPFSCYINVWLLVLICSLPFVNACTRQDRSYSVKIIIPNGYRGLLKIRFDPTGEKRVWQNTVLLFKIPPSGVLAT